MHKDAAISDYRRDSVPKMEKEIFLATMEALLTKPVMSLTALHENLNIERLQPEMCLWKSCRAYIGNHLSTLAYSHKMLYVPLYTPVD